MNRFFRFWSEIWRLTFGRFTHPFVGGEDDNVFFLGFVRGFISLLTENKVSASYYGNECKKGADEGARVVLLFVDLSRSSIEDGTSGTGCSYVEIGDRLAQGFF